MVGVGHGVLRAVLRSLDFMHSEVGKHWKVLSREVTIFPLAAVWRSDCRGKSESS